MLTDCIEKELAPKNRIAKYFDSEPKSHYDLIDGDQVIAEYDGSGTLLRKYIYGPGIDEPVKGLSPRGTVPEWYYHFDGLGSVSELTDSVGNVVEKYEYDAYGNTIIKDGSDNVLAESAVGNPYGFTGRRLDPETGLYYYRARYYSPTVGRFLQTDPIGYTAGINLYSYVVNNPVNFTDPFGLCKDKPWWEKLEDILIPSAYADEILKDPSLGVHDKRYQQLMQEYNKLVLELILKVGVFYVGLGGAMITGGVIIFPVHPVAGSTLIVGGVALEVKGFYEFVNWAERYGSCLNQIREYQKEYSLGDTKRGNFYEQEKRGNR